MGAFGNKFRAAREKKNLSLDDVSNVTKISSRMLQAIEEENFDVLPGGVFNKGFIRAYAKHLGLNDEEAISDYLACLRQAQIAASEAWNPAPEVRPAKAEHKPAAVAAYQKPRLEKHGQVQVESLPGEEELPDLQLPRAEDVRPPRRDYPPRREISWRFPVVGLVIVLLAATLWIHRSRQHTQAATPSAASQLPAPVAQSPSSASNPHPAALAATTAPAAVHSPQPSQAANATASSSDKPSSPSKAADLDHASDVTVRTFPAATTAKPAAKPVASFKLVIRASETSWIAVTADGQSVTHETLIAPAEFPVHATREIVARVGNAAGVSFLWNGKEIPAQGSEAEVKTYIFDSSGMRSAAPTPPSQ